MKKLLIILGNGFTIDFIKQIGKEGVIDPVNLFRLGENVFFPDGDCGFLSYKYCPTLWQLGAKPEKNSTECISIIEEIITCSNMFFEYIELSDKEKVRMSSRENLPLYIKAYMELIAFIKQLFIEYNTKITDEELKKFIKSGEWGWSNYLQKTLTSQTYEKISIVTYNYDVWLERILHSLDINFNVKGFSRKKTNIEIIKPHGSISFMPKRVSGVPYQLSYDLDLDKIQTSKIRNSFLDINNSNKCYIIPPAGDSSRRKSDTWAKQLRNHALSAAKNVNQGDDVIICGLSYWHVDRKELDDLLIRLDRGVNLTFVNPFPPKDLNAVLMTLFSNYKLFRSSETLRSV